MGCGASTPSKYAAPTGEPSPSRAVQRQSSNLSNRPSEGSHEGFAAFISHAKAEASMEARFLQTELEGLFQKRVFLDSDDLRDLRKLQDHVRECDVFLLVQSASVLTRPYCLLELCVAIEAGKPIVGVSLSGAYAYDFAAAQALLTHLDTQLEQLNPGASELLISHGFELRDAAWRLSSVVPKIISVDFATGASRNVLNATLADLKETMQRATAVALPDDRDAWLASRPPPSALPPPSAAHQHGGANNSFNNAASLSSLMTAPSTGPAVAPITIAVGFSSDAETAAATGAAYRQISRKLAKEGGQEFDLIVCSYSFQHHGAAVGEALRSLAPGAALLGTSAMFGLVVESNWKEPEGPFLALQGFHDPEGVYSTFLVEYEEGTPRGTMSPEGMNQTNLPAAEYTALADAVRAAVVARTAAAADAAYAAGCEQVERRTLAASLGQQPQLLMAFSSLAAPEAALEAVMGSLSRYVPVCGGGAAADAVGFSHMGELFHSGKGEEGVQVSSATAGFLGAMCWPSVHVAGAFCTGLTPDTQFEGTITQMSGRQEIVQIDHRPAWEVLREWYARLTDEDVAGMVEAALSNPMMRVVPEHMREGAFTMMEMLPHMADVGEVREGVAWVDEEGRVGNSKGMTDRKVKDFLKIAPLGISMGVADGDEFHKVNVPVVVNTRTGSFACLVECKEGQRLCTMHGKPADVVDRVATVAKQVMRNAGMSSEGVAGCFSYSCGIMRMLGGAAAMQGLAEKLADATGVAPTLGMVGGPEFGTMMGDTECSAVGAYTYSAIVFAKTLVSQPMAGTTFAMADKRGSAASMMLSKAGAVLTDDSVTVAESVATGR